MRGGGDGGSGTDAESFGERLRRLRVARGLRVTDVAYAAGVTEGSIRQMEAGQTKGATLLVGLRIAKSLGVSPEYLAIRPFGLGGYTRCSSASRRRISKG